jgi:Xaa-Pro aminopeptidase
MGAGPARSAMAHPRASTYRIDCDDIVQLCFCGPNYFSYQLGFDRPIFCDERRLTDDQRRLLDLGLLANQAALEAIRPGVPASEVHAMARHVVERAGLAEERAHRTGRGVGASEAEPPELRESDPTLLEPGMTFTVEPGLYVPGVAGVRFGDTVAVTDSGYEMLTPAPYGWGGL